MSKEKGEQMKSIRLPIISINGFRFQPRQLVIIIVISDFPQVSLAGKQPKTYII